MSLLRFRQAAREPLCDVIPSVGRDLVDRLCLRSCGALSRTDLSHVEARRKSTCISCALTSFRPSLSLTPLILPYSRSGLAARPRHSSFRSHLCPQSHPVGTVRRRIDGMNFESDVDPASPGPLARSDVRAAMEMEPDVERGSFSRFRDCGDGLRSNQWLRQGGASLADVMRWPEGMLDAILSKADGSTSIDMLRYIFTTRGLLVNTDYSGMGGVEIALGMLLVVIQPLLPSAANVLFWRAADLAEECRRILLAPAKGAPEHVFGDLMSRVPKDVRRSLRRAHATAAEEFRRLIDTGIEARTASEQAGKQMVERLLAIVQSHTFDMDARSWCYKHHQLCRVHGPEGDASQRLRLAAAGSPCTSWSRMGRRAGWAAKSALAFAVWCGETLAAMPDIILHECTLDFDWSVLDTFFGSAYIVCSFAFSPTDLGIPSSRPRRYTLLVAKERFSLRSTFDGSGFGRDMFRRCMATAHIYACAPTVYIERYLHYLAEKRHLPATSESGEQWPMRMLLRESLHQRLLAYERAADRLRGRRVYIVNLMQEWGFVRRFSELAPTLMTRTSLLWDMSADRLFIPEELLVMIGIPIFAAERLQEDRVGIEVLALAGDLQPDAIRFVTGNGMHMGAVGSVLLWTFSVLAPATGSLSHPPCMPARGADAPESGAAQ